MSTEERRDGGGGDGRPLSGWSERDAFVVRHEQEPLLSKRSRLLGFLRAKRHVERLPVEEVFALEGEQLVQRRVPPNEDDSGRVEELPDGSISIPVFREELVVTKRTVLAERIVIAKEAYVAHEQVRTELLRERVEIDADDGVEIVEG